jgi:hypothetical protein
VLKRNVRENPWFLAAALSGYKDKEPPAARSTAGYACDGDFSHLCEDYGCVRKGNLSTVMRGS